MKEIPVSCRPHNLAICINKPKVSSIKKTKPGNLPKFSPPPFTHMTVAFRQIVAYIANPGLEKREIFELLYEDGRLLRDPR